jgi:hypothetical protein
VDYESLFEVLGEYTHPGLPRADREAFAQLDIHQ